MRTKQLKLELYNRIKEVSHKTINIKSTEHKKLSAGIPLSAGQR